MTEYTKQLSAEQLIAYIANDYTELSHEKVLWQRNDWQKICREWLAHKSPIEQIQELAPQARIEMLENEVKNLRKALEIYDRERNRYKHAKPEMTGEFFIAGSHGPKDDNAMPQFVEVCPAYGVGWVMIYEDTGRTINYEGS